METIYPDDEEIKFRKKNFCVLEDILNDKIECTICNSDLLNGIISKKTIMVHRSHLFLCCCNCFFKLCEGNEYSCILCKSNNELSNCKKCNLNICSRCVENHNFHVSNGILKKCFNCKPNMLWKQRALAANVLKIFSSQLDMPNGLLVNEIDREQTVRKYLVAEAKTGQNSITKSIKDHMSLNFILNSYKMTINSKLSEYSPKLDVTQMDDNMDEFIKMCEDILEKTCSTLTNFKRIFNLNSHLSPGVSSIIKSLLKFTEEEDIVISSSQINGHFEKTVINNEIEQLLDNGNTRILRSANKPTMDGDVLNKGIKSIISGEQSSTEETRTKITVDKQSDDSVSPHRNVDKLSNNIHSVVEQDEIIHPLDLFNEICSDEDNNVRQLRSRKSIKYNEEVKTKKVKKKTNDEKLDDKSDDEKEIDRLINLGNIKNVLKKVIITSEDGIIGVNENTSSKLNPKSSKNEEDKMELINQIVKTIDVPESGSDVDSSQNEYPLKMIKDFFSEVLDATNIPLIQHEPDSNESDDSSILDVINTCLTTCHKPGIDYYRNKNQEKNFDLSDIDTVVGTDEENNATENEGTSVKSELSNKDETSTNKCLRRVSPFKKISDDDDSDSSFKIKKLTKGTKRKLMASNDSDSSSKFFKKTPKKQTKNCIFEMSSTSDSSDSSFCISPIPIKTHRKRIQQLDLHESDEVKSSSSGDDSDNVPNSQINGRKNIRKLKKKTELSQLTKDAIKEEDLRRKRMEERQKLYNEIYDQPKEMESCKKLVLDFDPVTKEELVSVHPDLVKFLKPHQVEGIKFLWVSVFESVETIKNKHKGNGSIVAHCMGLGKTLQVITLVHTLFRYPELGIKTVLVVTPHATIENWCKEFSKWLSDIHEDKNFYILNLTESKTYDGRKKVIDEWRRKHGVLVTSYQLYRTIVNYKNIKKFPTITEGLIDPGPDLVICDEGHVLKNHESKQSKALSRMKTLRRIILTGTPLQNNLKEYHCMVDFIRPNLLGSLKDFTNRFINPITNGQYSDSTPFDVKLMKRRSHVLHRMLKGFVQRFDYSVLTPFLPPKHEYVIYLKMSDKQIELYKYYLDNHRQPDLFTNYHMLQMIWTHPKLLVFYDKRTELKREKQKFKDIEASFVNDDTSSSSGCHSDSTKVSIENEQNPGLEPSRAKISEMDLNWWKPLLSKTDMETVYPYSKFIMMFSILKECEAIGDKVLLFSQSLFTLDLIQDFLENAENLENDKGGPYGKSWTQGEDFFRIDGSVTLKVREECCSKFNDMENTKMRLLLLSTKAFNLGINLVGANRVIIFDVTWNPSLNVQSIFRVFRFGQIKPCYIYRLVAEGTMEQKVYERQISKLSMAFRVVDEHQIDRHYNAQDHLLYEFEPNTSEPKSTLNLPKDRLMAELILKHKDLVMDILEHDSLLQNNEEEELDESDRNAAWEDYQREREELNNIQNNLPTNNQFNPMMSNQLNPITNNHSPFTYFQRTPCIEDLTLFNTLSNLFPQATTLQLNDMISQVKKAQNVEQ